MNTTGREVDLLITNERREEHHLVLVQGRKAWLTHGSLSLLLTLIAGRQQAENGGYVVDPQVCYPVAVCRLRQAFKKALRHPRGSAFVQTGFGKEYRLKLGLSVQVDPSFLKRLANQDEELAQRVHEAFSQRMTSAA